MGRSVGSAYLGSALMADIATVILHQAGTHEQKRKIFPNGFFNAFCGAKRKRELRCPGAE